MGHPLCPWMVGPLTDEVNFDSFINTMAARLPKAGRKKSPALGSFIRSRLRQLEGLADHLNGEPGGHATREGQWDGTTEEEGAAWGIAKEIITGAAGAPQIPAGALVRFNELARENLVGLRAWRYLTEGEVRDARLRPAGPARSRLTVPLWSFGKASAPKLQSKAVLELDLEPLGQRGHVAGLLLTWYWMNPHRDRLKRCQRCERWFVDSSRNKSARRCTPECTVAWSNAQRSRSARRRAKH